MAITKELLANTRQFIATEDGAAWLASKLVPKYADSVAYDCDAQKVSVIRDGVTLFEYQYTINGVLYARALYEGIYKVEKADNTGTAVNQYGFTTSNGVVVCQERGGSYMGKVLFTLDNDDNTVIVMNDNFTTSTNDSAQVVRAGIRVAALPPAVIYTSASWSMTTMVPFPVYMPSGTIDYTPNAFFCPTSEYREHGKQVVINDKPYLMLGSWLLEDSSAQTVVGCGDAHSHRT